jgi:ribonuclease E
MSRAIKRMLINASHPEEIRVAIVNGQRLEDLDVEHPSKEQKKSNIYLAVISRIEPSLEAIFVNYGGNRHGFLPLKEIEPSYFLTQTNDPKSDIKRILKEGQELLIQVDKEERGNKGAALTTYISLAGCYLVLMPNNPKGGGISRRIEGDDRDEMRETLNALKTPDGMSVIIRTAGLGKKVSDLQWDLDVLLHHWTAIKSAAGTQPAPCLLHQESNIFIRTIRDNLKPDIKEILIDDEKVYKQAKQYMEVLRSDSKNIVQHYRDNTPLFTRFQIESQIEEAYQHEIRLPSGGSIVLDRTEALTAIDINSAQSTKGQDIENTALNTNLEAATEIARQLRLRDVGGLIVIDFIDMSYIKNQREVENKLREELQNDRAKIQLGRISRFGLLEMSRQRLKASLGENTQIICNKCLGKGSLRTIESLSLSLLRIIEEETLKPHTAEVQAQLPLELCTFLTNEKRKNIIDIENRYNVRLILIPNQHLIFPNYNITRIKATDTKTEASKSYGIIEPPKNVEYVSTPKPTTEVHQMSVMQQLKSVPKTNIQYNKPNLLKRLWSSLFEANNNQINTKKSSTDANANKHDKEQKFSNTHKEKRSFDKSEKFGTSTNNLHKQKSSNKYKNRKRHTHTDNLKKQKHEREPSFLVEHHDTPENSTETTCNITLPPVSSERQQTFNNKQPVNHKKPRENNNLEKKQNQQRPKDQVIKNYDHNHNAKIISAQETNNKYIEQLDVQVIIEKTIAVEIQSDLVKLEEVSTTEQNTSKVFKKRPSITKVNNKDNLTKRSFYPKKKLKFENEKYSNDMQPINKLEDHANYDVIEATHLIDNSNSSLNANIEENK